MKKITSGRVHRIRWFQHSILQASVSYETGMLITPVSLVGCINYSYACNMPGQWCVSNRSCLCPTLSFQMIPLSVRALRDPEEMAMNIKATSTADQNQLHHRQLTLAGRQMLRFCNLGDFDVKLPSTYHRSSINAVSIGNCFLVSTWFKGRHLETLDF